MMPSRLVRAVCPSSTGTSSRARSSGLTLDFLHQLPRTARTPAFRVPGATFRRWNSTEGEKVKGQVIGIDLGMLLRQYPCVKSYFSNGFLRYYKLGRRRYGGQDPEDHRERRRYVLRKFFQAVI